MRGEPQEEQTLPGAAESQSRHKESMRKKALLF
jgi:hypothetical protein